jgi:hypothetical protein
MKGDPSELPGYKIEEVRDLIAPRQSTVTSKAAILPSAPGSDDFRHIYFLTPL